LKDVKKSDILSAVKSIKQINKEKAFNINLKLIIPQKQAKNNIHSENINNFIP